jgi:hypothetical protein
MKKIRITLAAIAVAIAIGASAIPQVASMANGTVDGYEPVGGGTPTCQVWPLECDATGTNLCKVGLNNSIQLKDSPSGSCGQDLFRN